MRLSVRHPIKIPVLPAKTAADLADVQSSSQTVWEETKATGFGWGMNLNASKEQGRKAWCMSSTLSWGSCHQEQGCKMPGTELCMHEGEQGEQLPKGTVSQTQQLSRSFPSQGLQQHQGNLRWQRIFHQQVPKMLYNRQPWHIRHFLVLKKVHKWQYGSQSQMISQEQLYSPNLNSSWELWSKGYRQPLPWRGNPRGCILPGHTSLKHLGLELFIYLFYRFTKLF